MAAPELTPNNISSTPSPTSVIPLANITDINWTALVSSPSPTLTIETTPPIFHSRHVILKLGPAGNRGLGLFATHSIPVNTVILSEVPLFTTVGYPGDDGVELKYLVEGLDENGARLYMSLHSDSPSNSDTTANTTTITSHQPTTPSHLLKIFQTNNFALEPSSNPSNPSNPIPPKEEFAIFALASRFNHACQHSFRSEKPYNISRRWDRMRREMVFTTNCHVEAGEELLIHYNLSEVHARRMLGGVSCPVCKYCGGGGGR